MSTLRAENQAYVSKLNAFFDDAKPSEPGVKSLEAVTAENGSKTEIVYINGERATRTVDKKGNQLFVISQRIEAPIFASMRNLAIGILRLQANREGILTGISYQQGVRGQQITRGEADLYLARFNEKIQGYGKGTQN